MFPVFIEHFFLSPSLVDLFPPEQHPCQGSCFCETTFFFSLSLFHSLPANIKFQFSSYTVEGHRQALGYTHIQGIFNERSSVFLEKQVRVIVVKSIGEKLFLVWEILVFPTSDTEKIENSLFCSISHAHLQPMRNLLKLSLGI